MNQILIVDNNLISIWVYPEKRIIHHQAKAYGHGTEIREALLRGAEAMELYRTTKLLSDDRTASALPPDDEAWAKEVWFPRAQAAGWKRWAIVKPMKIIGQAYMDRVSNRMHVEHRIDARMFTSPDEAMTWLVET